MVAVWRTNKDSILQYPRYKSAPDIRESFAIHHMTCFMNLVLIFPRRQIVKVACQYRSRKLTSDRGLERHVLLAIFTASPTRLRQSKHCSDVMNRVKASRAYVRTLGDLRCVPVAMYLSITRVPYPNSVKKMQRAVLQVV
jgi:hypothetical protein